MRSMPAQNSRQFYLADRFPGKLRNSKSFDTLCIFLLAASLTTFSRKKFVSNTRNRLRLLMFGSVTRNRNSHFYSTGYWMDGSRFSFYIVLMFKQLMFCLMIKIRVKLSRYVWRCPFVIEFLVVTHKYFDIPFYIHDFCDNWDKS